MNSKITLALAGAVFSLCLTFSPQTSVAMPGLSAPSAEQVVSGSIKETMNASGYTYMLVTSAGNDTWVAIPETPVKIGDTVKYYQGMEMKDFNSKTLDRTFSSIIFSPGIAGATTLEVASATNSGSNDSFSSAIKAERSTVTANPINEAKDSGGSAGAIVPLAELSVEKATGANSYTVSELFSQAKDITGKKIQVRGKVMKVSPAIMGKNWIHLQDGTGDPMQNTHDLVLTTSENIKLNATVTFEGIIIANKDFGAGYKYDAIVEEAILIK
ncbi:MAG: DNA-binding protein [Desulfotalea sp.]|nr:MAG: DNA-binding protein [Desulfotalea sp.]